jgi:hypothetical protein
MATIKLVNVDEHNLSRAAHLAVHFVRQYPDRMGIRAGVVFSNTDLSCPLYIYRTKSQIVVRGREDSPLGEHSE